MIFWALVIIALLFVAGFKNAAAGCAQLVLFTICALLIAFIVLIYIGTTMP